MRKLGKFSILCVLLCLFAWIGMRIADTQTLSHQVIRLHVVADSNSEKDQQMKLLVRDAILQQVAGLDYISDAEEAYQALKENIQYLEAAANRALADAGSLDTASVSLSEEAFPTRRYDSFALPSGVYRSLRVTIGDGEGENWWCVVFPDLCMTVAGEDPEVTAAGAGFSRSLTGAITGKPEYRIDFFFLNLLGKLENLFFFG